MDAGAPGMTGAETSTGAIAGAAEGGPALVGTPGKCGSLGRETSGGAAGTDAGGDENAAVSAGKLLGAGYAGAARKNSLAMRTRIPGSSIPPGKNSAPCRRLDPGSTGRGPPLVLQSLVLIVLSNLDIIEYRDGIVSEH